MVRARKTRVDELLEQIRGLSAEELEDLQARVSALLGGGRLDKRMHDIMELKGVGKQLWRSMDVEQYIEEERNSWR